MILPFDKIYIINLVTNKNRHDNCVKEFNKIGVDEKDLTFWYATRNNFLKGIENIIPSLKYDWYDKMQTYDDNTYSRIFDNAYYHYNIIKTSYERGFNSILVCEDDVNFIDNTDVVLDVFNRIPQDYDIIKFYNMGDTDAFKDKNMSNINYIKDKYRGYLACCMIYALSRNGMKIYIDYVENNGLFISDVYFEKLFDMCNLYSLDNCIVKEEYPFCLTSGSSSLQNWEAIHKFEIEHN